MSEPALFDLLDARTVRATELARGPWDRSALHGGPVSALLARAVERHVDDDVDWFVARLTVELERPVPVTPLAWHAVTTRPGRKVSLVDVELTSVDSAKVVARARALRIRNDHVPLPVDDEEYAPHLARAGAPPGPAQATPERSAMDDYVAFHNTATEHRFVEGGWNEPGAVIDWVRLRQPLLVGEETSPLQRVAAAVDFANGIARALSFDTHVFINPDLTLHVFRPLSGEWVGLASRCHYGERGVGMSDTAVYDTEGRIGRSNQSLLLDHLV
jgi:acyl-coenzyme A thioesterase PaaI-like protein